MDSDDFGVFQRCYTGVGGGVPAGCKCFDRPEGGQTDGDIDANDFLKFMVCKSEPGIPANPNCGN